MLFLSIYKFNRFIDWYSATPTSIAFNVILLAYIGQKLWLLHPLDYGVVNKLFGCRFSSLGNPSTASGSSETGGPVVIL